MAYYELMHVVWLQFKVSSVLFKLGLAEMQYEFCYITTNESATIGKGLSSRIQCHYRSSGESYLVSKVLARFSEITEAVLHLTHLGVLNSSH